MANAQVEKLKALGLRHGEKAVVGLSATLCLLFLVLAVTKKTIDLTPDDVNKHAKAAQSNIDARQPTEDILKRLEEQGIKEAGFEKLVDSQSKNALVADSYKTYAAWVSPEPGAGLIRSDPELVAPAELLAYPGRGGALIYAMTDDGKRIVEEEDKKPDDTTTKRRKKKKNRSGMMGGMGMGGMGMGMGGMGMGMGGMGMGMGGGNPDSPEAKKKQAAEQKRKARLLAGKDSEEKEDPKKKDEEALSAAEKGPWKEITKGLRWVTITGVLDHKKMRDNYLAALKSPTAANPNYARIDVQRQPLQSDGEWGEWEKVDFAKNRLILDNLPETEEELANADAIIENLVDPLPFLKSGLWERVHVVSLVPKEKKEVGKTGPGGMDGGEAGMYGGSMMGPMGKGMGKGMAGMGGAGMYGGAGRGMGGMPGMDGAMGGMMGGGAGGMGGGEENTNFQKSEADTLMVRSLDFTVEPDTTYRFQLRVVVYNPNYKRDDVAPGIDTSKLELEGPWSASTEAVTMPADVTPYAMNKTPFNASIKRTDRVSFQVIRWDPTDGVTSAGNFDAGPGEVIGEPAGTQIPMSDGTGTKSRLVDFNSRQLVIDTAGGRTDISPLGVTGAPLDAPATSLMLRADGSAILRGEFYDSPDVVRKDITANVEREIKDSNSKKKRDNSLGGGGGYGGMMGGMMGGMPGMGGGGMTKGGR